jgi:ubiquinone/menaquinone biosynthesis C-methylase UbiE
MEVLMVQREGFDNGRDIDWGKTSEDYAKYRPGPPASLYRILENVGVGLPGQKVLDQGTGTGVFGRQLAKQGCHVVGTDISENQIHFAKELAKKDGLNNIKFQVSPAEINPFADQSFDIISASQCFIYFDKSKWIPEAKRLLKAGGKVVITFFHWLPLEDPISGATEKLVLKHNPDWSAHSEKGHVEQFKDWFIKDFKQTALLIYDEDIQFTREVWRGRMRALRGIGASLPPEQVEKFDAEHDLMLKTSFGDDFIIPHRVITRVLTPR